jgi:hypothetical protein
MKLNAKLGIPKMIRTDRGRGLMNTRIQTFLERVGVEVFYSVTAFSGWKKPFVESMVRNIQHFLELAPGFAGHNPMQRAALRGATEMSKRRGKSEHELLGAELTDWEIENLIDRYLDEVYTHTPQRGLRAA